MTERSENQLYLFKDKRFLPIFLVQLCGCLNDSILKNALIILITFKLANSLALHSQLLVLMANAALVIPFIIFASIAGQIADRYERAIITRIIKLIEIAIVLLSAYGFYHTNILVLFICIILMGIHSTFFGPIKYSVLPDKLRKHELLSANGFIEAGTFLSILFGTIIGGFYNLNGQFVVILAVVVAITGFMASLFMPKSNNANISVKIKPNIIAENLKIVKYASSRNRVYLAILGISWFWFIGATILAQIPSLTRDVLGADENVANLFLAMFSIGVGVGSFLCSKIFNNKVTTKYVFIAAFGISFFCLDLFFASRIAAIDYQPEQLKTVIDFLSKKHYWRILIDLFMISVVSGLYVVPLFAVMQYFSPPLYRSRIIAANNLINSIFMSASSIIFSLLFLMGFTIPMMILVVAIANIIVSVHVYRLVPGSRIIPISTWRVIFRLVFNLLYQVEVKGLENYKKAGKKKIIIANHLSYIDPPLIASYIPENMMFAINMTIAKEWWVRPFLKILRTFPIEQNNPMAIKSLIEQVRKNKTIAIFPEGRTSLTGALMKVYEGPGMIADKTGASILPVRVEGTQFTRFSKIRKLMRSNFMLRRKITITVMPPVQIASQQFADNKQRRKYLAEVVYDIMSDMTFESSGYKQTLFQSVINAAKTYGSKKTVMEDVQGNRASYRSLLFKSFLLQNAIKKDTLQGENVGLMLPNTVACGIMFFAMQAAGRVATMINFTSGTTNIISGCKTAKVKTIYTARKFVKHAELDNLVKKCKENNIVVIYLEELIEKVSLWQKIKPILAIPFPQSYYNMVCPVQDEQKPAVVLFTSGTESKPKAVVLSHQNIQANICQVMARIDFNPHDCAFNALPMFHSFGLTTTVMMNVMGVKTFFYPTPLHYQVIPEMIYDVGATILFGTDTFLSGYANYAHPYDFYSLRYVIAGAEKLKSKTSELWFSKFGIRIFQGYGVTEASPVISVNTPMHERLGSVGRFMPKIEYHIEKVEGIDNGGRLCIKGPNIMLGYIKSDKPGVIVPPKVRNLGKGWYDTGDIVGVDDEKYITILGREKRFAKIGGEMISLTVIEELLAEIDAENKHAVVSIEDDRKGEKIVAFTNGGVLTRDNITKMVREREISELYIPKIIHHIPQMPVLTTGKLDYRQLLELAKNKNQAK